MHHGKLQVNAIAKSMTTLSRLPAVLSTLYQLTERVRLTAHLRLHPCQTATTEHVQLQLTTHSSYCKLHSINNSKLRQHAQSVTQRHP